MPKSNLAILISGRGSNMVKILEACQSGILEGLAEPKIVISNRADASGLSLALNFGCESLCVPSQGKSRESFESELARTLEDHRAKWIILAGFMRILSPQFIRRFRGQIINIHPADTRKHQGLHAYEWAFGNKLKSTHITVHHVDEGVDTGKIIMQEKVDLSGCKNLEDVTKKGLKVEHELYSRAIHALISEANSCVA